MSLFTYSRDADGIATLLWDDAARPVNVFNTVSIAALDAAVAQAAADASCRGVILASGKRGFVAGADLAEIVELDDSARLTPWFDTLHGAFRRMERSGKPWVAAINGAALGGGLEIALACHGRVASVEAGLIGLPEVRLGIFPGGGGTQRLPRLIGAAEGLRLILDGARLSPDQALAAGIVDAVVPAAELLDAAKAWLLAHPDATQPWDRPGFVVSGAATARPIGPGEPGIAAAQDCVLRGLALSVDAGLAIERAAIVALLLQPATRDRVRAAFAGLRQGRSRPNEVG
jgi:3-hydroxyacyl-CoA dehydrogenase/enoyl-CoA hydratase/3-hydroxybutyryl-CoA epimerase